jgi:hypothetical protein
MRTRGFVGVALAALCLMPGLLLGAPLLTPADIEGATGLHGVHLVFATAPGAVPGRDNYADASGKIVLWFQAFDARGFARARSQPAKTASGIEVEPKLFHTIVAGIGDDAFDSPDGKLQHALYVRKGQAAFGLIANVVSTPRGDTPAVSMNQLKALAKIVLSRM